MILTNLLPFLLLWNFAQAPDFSALREGVQVEACQRESHAHGDGDYGILTLVRIEKLDPCGFVWADDYETGRLEIALDIRVSEVTQPDPDTVVAKRAKLEVGRFGGVVYCKYCKQALIVQLRPKEGK